MSDRQFWIYMIAIAVSPLIAVQVSEWVRKWSEKRSRRLQLFTTLMRTRATGLAPEHVGALNSIDVEFYGERKVIDAWRSYQTHLNTGAATSDWGARKDQLFTALLAEMAEHLGYSFDKTVFPGTWYRPRGHGDLEEDQAKIRKGLVAVLEGSRALPVETREPEKKS